MAKIYIVGVSVFKYKTGHYAEMIPANVSKLTTREIMNYIDTNYSKLYIPSGAVYSYDCKHLCNFKITYEGITISNLNTRLVKD